jgi:hypothetical protein
MSGFLAGMPCQRRSITGGAYQSTVGTQRPRKSIV